MSKALMFGLIAVVELVIAIFAFRSGRIFLPLILGIAAMCFVIAAIGHALGKGGGPKPGA